MSELGQRERRGANILQVLCKTKYVSSQPSEMLVLTVICTYIMTNLSLLNVHNRVDYIDRTIPTHTGQSSTKTTRMMVHVLELWTEGRREKTRKGG